MEVLKADIEFKIDNNILEKIETNTDCKLITKTTCIGKTQVRVEILEVSID